MSAREISLPIQENSTFDYRQLGLVGMICSPALFLASFFVMRDAGGAAHGAQQIYASLGGLLYLTGALASATAMSKMRVTGSGRGASILYGVQVVGLILAMMFDVLEYAAPQLRGTTAFFITDLAYPLSHVLMLVVGAAVLKAGVWRGWRRVPVFLVGFALPCFIVSSLLFGRDHGGFIFPLLVTLGFFTLGLAVKTTERSGDKKK
jgi:hypothetical protein